MIRPFTCLSALLALGSGLYLYQTKHAAQLLDHQIARTADEKRVKPRPCIARTIGNDYTGKHFHPPGSRINF